MSASHVVPLAQQHKLLHELCRSMITCFKENQPMAHLDTIHDLLFPGCQYAGLQLQLDAVHVVSVPNQLNGVGQAAVLESSRSFLPLSEAPVVLLGRCSGVSDCWAGHTPAVSQTGYVLALPLIVDSTSEGITAMLVETQRTGTTPQQFYDVWHKYAATGYCCGVMLMQVPGKRKGALEGGLEGAVEGAPAPGLLDTLMCNTLLVAAMLAPMLLLEGTQRIMEAAFAIGVAECGTRYIYVPGHGLLEAEDSTIYETEYTFEGDETESEGASAEGAPRSEGPEASEGPSDDETEFSTADGQMDTEDDITSSLAIVRLVLLTVVQAGGMTESVRTLVHALPAEVRGRIIAILQHLTGIVGHAVQTDGQTDRYSILQESVAEDGSVYAEEEMVRKQPGRSFCNPELLGPWDPRGPSGGPDDDHSSSSNSVGTRSNSTNSMGTDTDDDASSGPYRPQQRDGQTDGQHTGHVANKQAADSHVHCPQQDEQQCSSPFSGIQASGGGVTGWTVTGEAQEGPLRGPVVDPALWDEGDASQKAKQGPVVAQKDPETLMYADQETETGFMVFMHSRLQQIHHASFTAIAVVLAFRFLFTSPFSIWQHNAVLAALLLLQFAAVVAIDWTPANTHRVASVREMVLLAIGISFGIYTLPKAILIAIQHTDTSASLGIPAVFLALTYGFLANWGGRLRFLWCRVCTVVSWTVFFLWVLPVACQKFAPSNYVSPVLIGASTCSAVLMAGVLNLARRRERSLRMQYEAAVLAQTAN